MDIERELTVTVEPAPGGQTGDPGAIVVETGQGGEGGDQAALEAAQEAQEAQARAVEEVADASVEIARIEADRDVTIAAIEADVATETHESQEDELTCLRNIEAGLRLLGEQITALSLSLAESNRSPENPAENLAESEAITPRADQEAGEAPEPPRRPKRSRWI